LGVLKKFLLIFSVLVICCLVNQAQTLAAGEQSVLGQIGRDGDCLITNSVAQEFSGEVMSWGNTALLWNGSKVNFLEQDENGFWNIKQEFDGYPYHYFSYMTRSENTVVLNALRETEDDSYGALYVFDRNKNGVWRQQQKINGVNCAISENIMVVGSRYYTYNKQCLKFQMKVYERDQNCIWQEKLWEWNLQIKVCHFMNIRN
jgi:hypothetical protein